MKSSYFKDFFKKQFLSFFSVFFIGFLLTAQTNNSMGCIDPVVSSTSGPGSICEGLTATLTAVHNGDEVNWFDAASGGNLVGTGTPFVTPVLNSTTSFWAQAINGGGGTPQTGGARVGTTATSSSAVVPATSPWGLAFNADQDFTINSVDVYLASSTPGDVVMQLKDNALNIIEQITVAAPAGNSSTPVQFTVNLDFYVPAGLDYNLVAESSPVMVREFSSGHPGFPYPIGTVGSVFGGTINDNDTNAGLYYFFYNWTVTPGVSCTSARVEEEVVVNSAPAAPAGDNVQTFNAGETLADLDVTGENLIWYSDAGGTIVIPDTTPLVNNTTYYVSQTIAGCESDLLAITAMIILGVEDETLSNLKVYPNPVSDRINLSNTQNIRNVTITNMLGQKVFESNYDLSFITINTSQLLSGSYFVKVTTEFGSKVISILKK